MIRFVKKNQIDQDKYNQCIANALQTRIYAHTWYLDVVANDWSVLILDDYDAVMPLPIYSKLGIKYISQPFFTQQLGVFSKQAITEDIFDEFLKNIPKRFFKIALQFNSENKFIKENSVSKNNYILPLDNEYNFLYKNFSKGRKHAVQQGLKNQFTIKEIPFSELLDFCAKRSISINWMLYGQSPESLVEATNNYIIKYFSDINASAGGGSDIEFEEIKELEIPEQFVFMLGGERELQNIEAINVSGDSMEPTFSYNDIVFINRSKTDLNRGGIFTIRTEAGLFIKRVQRRMDGMLDVISDNSVYPVQTLNSNEVEVIGRVISRFGDVD